MKRITNTELKELAKSNLRDGGKLKALAIELLALRRVKTLAVAWLKLYETEDVDTDERCDIVEDATDMALDTLKEALREES